MGIGRIKKADLVARDWVHQRRQEGTFRVGESKSQVLDVMSDPRQGLNPRGLGEGVGRKSQVGSKEEALGNEVAAGRVGESERAYILLG